MCIIAYKPEGVAMPTKEDIEHMFRTNSDGAGYAIQGYIGKNGKFDVKYRKGFLKVEDLLKALEEEGDLTNKVVAIHCRIGTAGKNDGPTTHPFPLTRSLANMRKLQGNSEPVLFHNGVMAGLGGGLDEDSSDTQDFVGTVGVEFLRKSRMPSKAVQKVIGSVIGACRLLILYPNPKFPSLRWGTWHEHNGIFYSNEGYRGAINKYYSSGYYNWWEDDDEDWDRKYSKYDERGCNVADYAWPSQVEHWIKAKDKERLDTIIKRWTLVEDDGSYIKKYHDYNDRPWYVDMQELEIYDEIGKRTKEEAEEKLLLAEVMGINPDDDFILFEDEDQAIEWVNLCKLNSDNTYQFLGRKWWLDEVMLEAYTEEGIKRLFSTGVQGHVKREIQNHGTYSENANIMRDVEKQLMKQRLDEEAYEEWLDGYDSVPTAKQLSEYTGA